MRPRPLVDVDVPLPRDVIMDRFRRALSAEARCRGHVGRAELSLEVNGPERHAWSPRISLEVRPTEHGCHVRGHFGPHPNLWTLFVFIYSVQVVVVVSGAMYGLVQGMMSEPPTALWAALGATASLGLSCGVDLTGRRVGAGQMEAVRSFIDEVLPEARDRVDGAPAPGFRLV